MIQRHKVESKESVCVDEPNHFRNKNKSDREAKLEISQLPGDRMTAGNVKTLTRKHQRCTMIPIMARSLVSQCIPDRTEDGLLEVQEHIVRFSSGSGRRIVGEFVNEKVRGTGPLEGCRVGRVVLAPRGKVLAGDRSRGVEEGDECQPSTSKWGWVNRKKW